MAGVFTVFITLAMGVHPYLRVGEERFDAQDYEGAVAQLQLASQVPQLSIDERRRVFDLLAKSHLALGASSAAVDAYAELLAKDPNAPVPEGGPKVKEAFRSAKTRVFPADYVGLRQLPSLPGEVTFEVTDPWQRSRSFTLFERGEEPKAFIKSNLRRQGDLLRGTLQRLTRMYFVEALGAEEGQVVARLGSADRPLLVATPEAVDPTVPSPKRPEWIKWTVGGVSLLAVVAAIVLRVSAEYDSQQASMLLFADERKRLDDQAIAKAVAANVVGGIGIAGLIGTAALWIF